MHKSDEEKKLRDRPSKIPGLRSKRARYARASLMDMISKYERSSRKNFKELRVFFEDEDRRNFIRESLLEKRCVSFDTAWEGALSILNTIDRETNSRVKQADMSLLDEDLNQLKSYLKEKSL